MELLVCVASVGQAYRPQLERLHASLPDGVGLSVISDLDAGDLAGPHVFWHGLTRSPWHPFNGRFDWRLKADALRCGFGVAAVRSTTRFLYLDCDCFFADRALRASDVVAPDAVDIATLVLRERVQNDQRFAYSAQMTAFIHSQGTPEMQQALVHARLPLEQALLINHLTPHTLAFLEWWVRLADMAEHHGMQGDPDAVEIGLALELCGGRYAAAARWAPWIKGIHFTNAVGTFDLAHMRVRDADTPDDVRDLVAALISPRQQGRGWDLSALSMRQWASVVEYAQRERVAPMVYRATADAAGVPPEIRRSLKHSYRETAAQVLRLRAVLVSVLEALDAAGIPVVLLRGAALSTDVWPDAGLRIWGDIDLLVERRHVSAAAGALRPLGFTSKRIETRPESTLAHDHRWEFAGPGGTIVDLHGALFDVAWCAGPTAAEALLPHTRPVRVQGQPALVLTPELQLLHLCGHLALHGRGDDLLWLLDIAALIARYDGDWQWDVLCLEAQRLGLVTPLRHALTSAGATLSVEVAPDVLRRIQTMPTGDAGP